MNVERQAAIDSRLVALLLWLGVWVALQSVFGCAVQPPPSPVVVPFCSMPWANCRTCADVSCDTAVEQWWCCDEDGVCTPVANATLCPPSTAWVAYCEYGVSTPSTTPDGEGWECLDG